MAPDPRKLPDRLRPHPALLENADVERHRAPDSQTRFEELDDLRIRVDRRLHPARLSLRERPEPLPEYPFRRHAMSPRAVDGNEGVPQALRPFHNASHRQIRG